MSGASSAATSVGAGKTVGPTARARPGTRAFVLVIDACGIGALPDAERYGDSGTNTLAHLARAVGGLRLPRMRRLGLGSIAPLAGVTPEPDHAIVGRLHALGPGKDSIGGHWELMGVVLEHPLPVYPEGFPPRLVARLEQAMGRRVICNRPDNGLAAIEEFGAEHLASGALILYTSQDSVAQLAAHVERVPEEELYAACEAARAVMSGPDAVGRVIARPFTGHEGSFERTQGRRDLSVPPPSRSYLQELAGAGVEVHGVGKIGDLFAGVGIDIVHPGATNARALHSVAELAAGLDRGFVLANLIETDQVYGHRKDVEGFHGALRAIDEFLGVLLAELRAGDLLVVSADHGVDPTHPGTDHTREHVPLLALTGEMAARLRAGGRLDGHRHDGPMADVGASVLDWLTGERSATLPGRSFLRG